MNVCCICSADGVLSINTKWYCKDHLDECILDLVYKVSLQRGWDEKLAVKQIEAWLKQ